MDKIKYWLRWFIVLPGSILVAFLATFPLHWILYLIMDPNKEYDMASFGFFMKLFSEDISVESVERLIYPAVMAVVFVIAGYKIAPKYKFKTAVVLFVVYLLTFLVISILAISNNVQVQFSTRAILALFGAVIGLTGAKSLEDKTKSSLE